MPFITDKININCPFLDRRTKLLPCQREMVVYYHNLGYSQRKIAKMFNVSRRLIIFTIYPERLINNKKERIERGGSKIYYNREKHNLSTRKHRRYKYETLKESVKNL